MLVLLEGALAAFVLVLGVVQPRWLRLAIVASAVLVTADNDLPLHLVPVALVAGYLITAPFRLAQKVPRPNIIVLCITLVTFLTLLIATLLGYFRNGQDALDEGLRLSMNAVIFCVVAANCKTYSDLKQFVAALVSGATFAALIGLSIFLVPQLAGALPFGLITEEVGTRATGLHRDPNYCCMLLSAAVLYGVGLLGSCRTHTATVLAWVSVVACGVCAVLTFSRTGLISLAAGWIVFTFGRTGSIRRTFLSLVPAVVLLTFIAVDPGVSLQLGVRAASDHSLLDRVYIWQEVIGDLTAVQDGTDL